MSLETKDVVAAVKRRPLVFTCCALSFALGLLLYFRLDVPSELETQLAEREKERTRLNNNVKFAVQLEAQLEALRGANEKIAAGTLRSGELPRNQQLFYELEAASGVKLVEFRQQPVPPPAKGAPSGAYVGIPFSFTVEGDYAQIIDFLHRLDRVPALGRVTSASFGAPTEGVQKISLSVVLIGTRS
jgi:hypothetical protein